jgi:sugar phosphate isomerase/epimerase
MIDFSLSTVACPHLTIAAAARLAGEAGYDALELRTFGAGSTGFACDPALTDESKVRGLLAAEGICCSSVATGVTLDQPIWPPIIGRALFDQERSVREAERAIDLAAQIEAPLVRVFGHERQGRESLASATRRIAWRLGLVCDHARNSGVRVVVENGGSFPRARDLAELLAAVGSPLLGASYNAAVGAANGDDPREAVRLLGRSLWLGRVKDAANGRPVQLGEGDCRPDAFIAALADAGYAGTVVFEWDASWVEGLAPAETVAARALELMCGWAGQSDRASGGGHGRIGALAAG